MVTRSQRQRATGVNGTAAASSVASAAQQQQRSSQPPVNTTNNNNINGEFMDEDAINAAAIAAALDEDEGFAMAEKLQNEDYK